MAGDRVFLEGMAFYGYHGVRPEERALGQRFLVDVALAADLRPAGEADDLALTIDLFDVHERVRAVVEGPACLTIEAVAEAVAAALLAATPARAVAVTVRKAAAPRQARQGSWQIQDGEGDGRSLSAGSGRCVRRQHQGGFRQQSSGRWRRSPLRNYQQHRTTGPGALLLGGTRPCPRL